MAQSVDVKINIKPRQDICSDTLHVQLATYDSDHHLNLYLGRNNEINFVNSLCAGRDFWLKFRDILNEIYPSNPKTEYKNHITID